MPGRYHHARENHSAKPALFGAAQVHFVRGLRDDERNREHLDRVRRVGHAAEKEKQRLKATQPHGFQRKVVIRIPAHEQRQLKQRTYKKYAIAYSFPPARPSISECISIRGRNPGHETQHGHTMRERV